MSDCRHMNTVCHLSLAAALLLAPPVQNRAGAIEGVVVSAIDGAPIPKAAVTLNSVRSESVKTITDHEGRFAFRDLPAGQFGIKVSRMGYFASGLSDKDVTLTIAERQELKGVLLLLRPGGAISGRITAGDGDPLTNVTIEALQYSYQDGQLALTTAKFAVAITDDRGEYRIFWLAPGRYYIRAVGIAPGRGLVLTPQNNAAYLAEETYAPSYFPGTSNADTATAIDLRPGQEYDGADLRLLTVRTHHIRGVVADAAKGIPAARASVSLLASYLFFAQRFARRANEC
jgi:protocatechuate 3,4-dioxygenase beta subunit